MEDNEETETRKKTSETSAREDLMAELEPRTDEFSEKNRESVRSFDRKLELAMSVDLEAYQSTASAQASLEDELDTGVDELSDKIYESVRSFDRKLKDMKGELEAEKATEAVYSKFDSVLPPLLQWKKEKNEKIESLERSYGDIYRKWEWAEAERRSNETEIENLRSQILMQSTYCANLGAVLGHLVWRASNEPEMINFWLSEQSNEKILGEFLAIADTTLGVFFKAYGDVVPPKTRHEYKFAMGLLGTLTNVSASAEGRQFLIENTAGKCLVKNLVKHLPLVPMTSGHSIKKLILLTLWNLCVNKECLRCLLELKIGLVVEHCLEESSPSDIQQLGLNLLRSITHDLDSGALGGLLENLQIKKIQRIARGPRGELANTAVELFDYFSSREKEILGTAKTYFNT